MFRSKIAIFIVFICICNISVSEQCGYNVSGTSGFILSPNYPSNYDNNLTCYYTITSPEDTAVLLDIQDMHTEQGYDYIYIYNGPSTSDSQLAIYSGIYSNVLINASTNQVLVRFTSDASNAYKGFNITFNSIESVTCGGDTTGSSGSIQSPHYPQPYDPNLDCYYSLSTPDQTALTLEIDDLDLQSCCDFINIYDGPTVDYKLLGTFTGQSSNVDPIYASTNQALVYFHTDDSVENKGFQISFMEREPCGEDRTGSYGAIISPGYPVEEYPSDQNCYYKVTTSENTEITFDIVDMDLEKDNDYIEIYDGPSTSSPLIGRYSGVLSNIYIYASTNEALVYFHSDSSGQGKGFYIYYTETESDQKCPASSYTTDSGFLGSPRYPEAYPNNTDCYYSITTSDNTQLTLHTNFLEVEKSSNCTKDYVELFDGPTADNTSLAKLCGSGPVYDIVSSSNEVFVHFHSDSQTEQNGFNITYNTNPCPNPIYFYDDFGTIYSPGFPLYNYPNLASCNYIIETSDTSQVHLTLVFLSMQSTASCTSDSIKIYDGPDETHSQLDVLCGEHSMIEYQTSSNEVLIQFQTDSSNDGRGFVITYVSTYNYGDDLDDLNAK